MTTNKTVKFAAIFAASLSSASLFAQAAKSEAEASGFDVPWTERESLFIQPLVDTRLPDIGFTPSLSWTGEQWSNVGGGMERGTAWNSLFTIGIEQDFSKLFKVENAGTFGMTVFYNVNSHKGNAFFEGFGSAPSNIHAGDMFRVFEIYYANSFESEIGTFSFRIGQLAADEDFMGIDYADLFLNSNFGAIPAVAGMGLAQGGAAFSQYANATLGATVAYEKDGFDVILGFYNGDAGDDLSGNHGFDYELRSFAFWYQLGYNYSISGFDGRVQFGGNYHSGKFERFDGVGTERNFYSFYLGVQQEVLKSEDGDPILGIYGRLAYSPENDISENTFYIEGGLNWFAPIPGRDDDVFGLGISHMFADKEARSAGVLRNQTVIEATYKFQFPPAISLQPSMQVFFNPETDKGDREACFIGGARLEVLF